jgi:outer membrane protein assembly factor BamB
MSDATSQANDSPSPAELAAPRPGGSDSATAAGERRLRLWPGLVIVALQWAVIVVPGWVAPATMVQFWAAFVGPVLAAVALLAWWLFASRLRWTDRLLGAGAFLGGGLAAYALCEPLMRDGLGLFVLPWITTAWVVWLLVTPFLRWPVRRGGLLAVFLIAWGCCPLLRLDGVYGDFAGQFGWRWGATAEDKFLAEHHDGSAPPATTGDVAALHPGDWPGFRGPRRDGRLTGVRIDTDWAGHPPRQLWRHRVGPGWGSFAVVGRLVYTQEQRGEVEAVVCYDADTGEEVWVHADQDRFKEKVSGVGPRATPTFHDGKVYALGASGVLNCLDAATGKRQWQRDVKQETGAKVPEWGFASSPLVWHGLVTVFAGGPDNKGVAAYDAESGEPVWQSGDGRHSYSSPQPARLGDVDQILIASDAGLTALHATSGAVLWRHERPTEQGLPRCVQPALVGATDVLLGSGLSMGERRVAVRGGGDAWSDAAEVWTSKALKAYYNDRVVHKGHVYGFDANIFTCLSLDDGEERWRGGRYGNGQVLLLADQDLLLVLSEKGEVVLVAADPGGHRELARFRAIEGKTWNHPVVARGRLFVRNGAEAACYELPGEGDGADPKP